MNLRHNQTLEVAIGWEINIDFLGKPFDKVDIIHPRR